LYDDNRNGVWDPGSFIDIKRQPEVVRAVSRRLNIRSNWDNEVDINLDVQDANEGNEGNVE
jgi:hypothetical protein